MPRSVTKSPGISSDQYRQQGRFGGLFKDFPRDQRDGQGDILPGHLNFGAGHHHLINGQGISKRLGEQTQDGYQ